MFSSIRSWLLYRLLAERLGVDVDGDCLLSDLSIKEYTLDALNAVGLYTVRDAVMAYCLHHDTPGVGKGSWDDLLSEISR